MSRRGGRGDRELRQRVETPRVGTDFATLTRRAFFGEMFGVFGGQRRAGKEKQQVGGTGAGGWIPIETLSVGLALKF